MRVTVLLVTLLLALVGPGAPATALTGESDTEGTVVATLKKAEVTACVNSYDDGWSNTVLLDTSRATKKVRMRTRWSGEEWGGWSSWTRPGGMVFQGGFTSPGTATGRFTVQLRIKDGPTRKFSRNVSRLATCPEG